VIGIDNFYDGSMNNIQDFKNYNNFKLQKADIRDKKFIQKITKDVDIIFHKSAFIDQA